MREVSSTIDVVIPVYNSPVLVGRCIDSVITHLGRSIRYIHIQDDASDHETREMLDQLPYPNVRVFHASKNQGFGLSVNDAISRSDATLILVLNSDTEISENFLPSLCIALATDPRLAVIIPAGSGNTRDCGYDLSRYPRQPGGYIITYRLAGYAFLIRREVFQEIGGFDPAYGRGYYEDIDLGRRIDQCCWRMGLHPDTRIYHKGGGSFGRNRAYRLLKHRNRLLYFSRYPNAQRNILLFSGNHTLAEIPPDLHTEIENVFRGGGSVHWLTPEPASQLFCLHMNNHPTNLITVIKLMVQGWRRADKRISEVWMLPSNTYRMLRALLVIWCKIRCIKLLLYEERSIKKRIGFS